MVEAFLNPKHGERLSRPRRKPVEHQGMEVDVQVEPSTEALDDGDASRMPVQYPAPVRLLALEAEERPHVDAEHSAAEGVVPGEQVAEAEASPLPLGFTLNASRPRK